MMGIGPSPLRLGVLAGDNPDSLFAFFARLSSFAFAQDMLCG